MLKKYRLSLLFLFILLLSPIYLTFSYAEDGVQKKKTICLNMIVKNESHVIKRCLDSVKPIINYWVVVDTGSSDGTQDVIKEHMKDIPGELHERPWKNFAANRNQALELAKDKADFILFMDADDWLQFEPDFSLPDFNSDIYYISRSTLGGAYTFTNHQMIRASLPWRWEGAVHEYLVCDQSYSTGMFNKVTYIICGDGSSHKDPQKYLRYVKLLEEDLQTNPNNTRTVFYIGESYRFAGEKEKAIVWYEKRASMGNWPEEVYWSKFQIASLKRELNFPLNAVIDSYINARNYRPHRSEAVYALAEVCNQNGKCKLAYECIKAKNLIPNPPQKDLLFTTDWMEQYGLNFQMSISAYYTENYQESIDACDAVLSVKNLPDSFREQTKINRNCAVEKLNLLKK